MITQWALKIAHWHRLEEALTDHSGVCYRVGVDENAGGWGRGGR